MISTSTFGVTSTKDFSKKNGGMQTLNVPKRLLLIALTDVGVINILIFKLLCYLSMYSACFFLYWFAARLKRPFSIKQVPENSIVKIQKDYNINVYLLILSVLALLSISMLTLSIKKKDIDFLKKNLQHEASKISKWSSQYVEGLNDSLNFCVDFVFDTFYRFVSNLLRSILIATKIWLCFYIIIQYLDIQNHLEIIYFTSLIIEFLFVAAMCIVNWFKTVNIISFRMFANMYQSVKTFGLKNELMFKFTKNFNYTYKKEMAFFLYIIVIPVAIVAVVGILTASKSIFSVLYGINNVLSAMKLINSSIKSGSYASIAFSIALNIEPVLLIGNIILMTRYLILLLSHLHNYENTMIEYKDVFSTMSLLSALLVRSKQEQKQELNEIESIKFENTFIAYYDPSARNVDNIMKIVLKGINANIEGVSVLIGESGSGKSTILALLNGKAVQQGGSVTFFGQGKSIKFDRINSENLQQIIWSFPQVGTQKFNILLERVREVYNKITVERFIRFFVPGATEEQIMYALWKLDLLQDLGENPLKMQLGNNLEFLNSSQITKMLVCVLYLKLLENNSLLCLIDESFDGLKEEEFVKIIELLRIYISTGKLKLIFVTHSYAILMKAISILEQLQILHVYDETINSIIINSSKENSKELKEVNRILSEIGILKSESNDQKELNNDTK